MNIGRISILAVSDSFNPLVPSSKLEHEAHRFGLREKALPFVDMASPQQMQTGGFTQVYSQRSKGSLWFEQPKKPAARRRANNEPPDRAIVLDCGGHVAPVRRTDAVGILL